jgi:hypothetical protein
MSSILTSRMLAALLVAGSTLVAAESAAFRWHLDVGPSYWTRTRLTYGANDPVDPSTAAKTDRTYDDGFNKVDASGNLGDGTSTGLASRTGNFGFISDSQVDLKAGTLALHRTTALGGIYRDAGNAADRPSWQANLRLSLADVELNRRDWGVEAGLDWARFKDASNGPVAASLRVLTDTYALGGVVPQRAPYTGRFSPLPGDQRIGDTPTRSIATVAGTVNGSRSFSAKTTIFRVGGWWELKRSSIVEPEPEADKWSIFLRGGLAFSSTKANFSVDEQPQANGVAAGQRVVAAGSGSRSSVGLFLGANARRILTPRVALIGGADLLRGPKLTVSQGDRYTRLDLSRSIVFRLALEVGLDRLEENKNKKP